MIKIPGVEFSEWDKKILRMVLKAATKRLEKGEAIRENDLKCNPNPVVKALSKLIDVTANNLKPWWQRTTVNTYGKFALWLVVKDTAYKDAFFWMLYKLLKMSDKLLPLIEPYVRNPEEWFPNLWEDSKNDTKKGREDGTIPMNKLSLVEQQFVQKNKER